MMPAINDKRMPMIRLLIILYKKRYASRAPKGSLNAEIKVYKNAFFLLLVE